jgi:multidrug efflux pump subunit AcrA (membrane-fusion protein)
MERYKSVGEFIETDAVVRVAQLNPLHVEVVLPVEYLGMLSTGRRAKVTPSLPAFDSQIGTVTQVDQVADAASGTFGARLSLPNPDHVTPAGLRCRVAFLDPDESLDVVAQEQPLPESGDETAQTPVPDPTDGVETVADTGIAAGDVADLSCFRIGPLNDETLASKLSDAIGATYGTSHSSLELVKNPGDTGYRVLLAAQPDVMAARDVKANLQDRGIKDFYEVLSGPYKGRVSVGYYRKQQNALLRQQSLGARGIDVEVIQEPGRGTSAYWVNLFFDGRPRAQSELQIVAKGVAPGASVQPSECGQQQVTRMD